MGMPKARLVVQVSRGGVLNGVAVTVKDGEHGNYGEPYNVALEDLKGAEVMRAAANVGVDQSHGWTSEQRMDAIRSIVWTYGYTPKPFVPKPRSERTATPIRPALTPAPIVPVASPDEPVTLADAFKEVSEPAHESVSEPVASMPETIPAALSQLGSLGESIWDAIVTHTPRVDLDAITTNVGNLIDAKLRDVDTVVHRITVNDVPQKDLPKLHHAKLPDVISAIGSGSHVFLSGPAGSGKSTIGEQAFTALGMNTYAMSCDPSMMRTAIFGFIDAHGNFHGTPVSDSFDDEVGGLLIDEMDNGHPSILAGMNMLLANGSAPFADKSRHHGPKWQTIATANTWGTGATAEYVGRNPIDAATLNRFTVRIEIGYDLKMERLAALQYATDDTRDVVNEWIDRAQSYRRNVDRNKVRVVISPRDIISGAKMITRAGWTISKVLEHGILAGLNAETIGKVTQ